MILTGETLVNESRKSRGKVVYQARDYSHSDLQSHLWVDVRNFLEVAHWATNPQIQIGVRGYASRRYTTLERLLKSKTRSGDIRSGMYGKSRIYAKPIKTRNFDLLDTDSVYHGLSCTECLIRLMTPKEGDPLPEKAFRGYRRVPEFGILYKKTLSLVEFSTKHDTEYSQKIRGKLIGYKECLTAIEHDFNTKAIVVFILDVTRDKVRRIIEKYRPEGQFFFCDFKTFKNTKLGDALISPIWIWTDGKEYSLK